MRKEFTRVGLAALATSTFALACVDPEEQLDEFSDRVVDADQGDDVDAAVVDEIPNASGTYLLGLAPAPAPHETFEFLAEVELDFGDEGVALALSAQPLDADTREPVGDPMTVEDVDIDATARFEAVVSEFPPDAEDCEPEPEDPVVIPNAANPLGTGELWLTATLEGAVRSEELICGDVEAVEFEALGCLDLSGSTFAMVPAEDGTDPDDLPEPKGSCPDD